MNILITGANGQLGKELNVLSDEFKTNNYFFASKTMLDITNLKHVKEYILKNKINTIINCAAYTNVEKAEDEFKAVNNINHLAVRNLAEVSKANNISLIHISTDYVFDGNNKIPYSEDDITKPINNYGKTKLSGEQAMLVLNPSNSIIIRTSWLYSTFNNNFVKTMLRLANEKEEINVIDNQFGSPTNAKDLAKTILNIIPKIKNDSVAVYHYSNEGNCNWFQFAKEIMNFSKSNCKVNPINSSDYPTKAKRPNYSLMNTSKIQKEFNINIPFWKESLKNTIEKRTQQ